MFSESSGCYQCDPTIVAKVSEILGISQDDFKKVVTRPATPRTSSPASSLTPSTTSSRANTPTRSTTSTTAVLSPSLEQQPWTQQDGSPLVLDNVNRLAVNLYSELLTRLVSFINRSIRPQGKHSSSIILFDSPGFQNPTCVGRIWAVILPKFSIDHMHFRWQAKCRVCGALLQLLAGENTAPTFQQPDGADGGEG